MTRQTALTQLTKASKMTAKKTVKVDDIRTEVNRLLALELTQAEKRGLCSFLETILHDTENYKGFNHRYWNSVGYQLWLDADEPDFPEKNKYINGPGYEKLKKEIEDTLEFRQRINHEKLLMFRSENQGEYSRTYY